MKRIERIAYCRVTEWYVLDINEKLAKEIEDSINRFLDKNYYPVEITVQMLEDVVDKKKVVDWERKLIWEDSEYEESLYGYIQDYLNDTIWEGEPYESDRDTDDWQDEVYEVNPDND